MTSNIKIDYSVLYKDAPCTTPQNSPNETTEYKNTPENEKRKITHCSERESNEDFYTRYTRANVQSEDIRIEINKAIASGKVDTADLLYKSIKIISLLTGDTALQINADRWKESI